MEARQPVRRRARQPRHVGGRDVGHVGPDRRACRARSSGMSGPIVGHVGPDRRACRARRARLRAIVGSSAVRNCPSRLPYLRDQVTALTEQVATLFVQKRIIRCYECNQEGHTLRDCPNRRQFRGDRRRCFNCGRPGHFERECHFPPQRGYQGNSLGQGNENGAHVTAYRRPKY